jgi:hypothetical protein
MPTAAKFLVVLGHYYKDAALVHQGRVGNQVLVITALGVGGVALPEYKVRAMRFEECIKWITASRGSSASAKKEAAFSCIFSQIGTPDVDLQSLGTDGGAYKRRRTEGDYITEEV